MKLNHYELICLVLLQPLTLYPLSLAIWQTQGQQSCSTAAMYLMQFISADWSFPFSFAALSHNSKAWLTSVIHYTSLFCGQISAIARPNNANNAMYFIFDLIFTKLPKSYLWFIYSIFFPNIQINTCLKIKLQIKDKMNKRWIGFIRWDWSSLFQKKILLKIRV